MKHTFANTLFARLFGLVIFSMVISQLLTFALLFALYGKQAFPGPPPPDATQMTRGPDLYAGGSARPEHPPGPTPGNQPGHSPGPRPGHLPNSGLVVTIVIEFLALALAAWFGAKVIARPIQQLSKAATELGDNVDRSPIPESGTVEARDAARAFNRMQIRLREQIAARARFLAAVSHDLRTPLTRMRLRVERLTHNDVTQKLRDDVLEMSAMLDATLDYLRDEAQTEASGMLDVDALVTSLVDNYQEQGLPISVSGHAAPILAQSTALRRCLTNLMENALRYGEKANVEIIDSDSRLTIEIRDRGTGIPADQLEAVMEPFYRLDSSRNKSTGGVGLGLAIAREAIQRQGGTLVLRNAENSGLVATVSLPRNDAA